MSESLRTWDDYDSVSAIIAYEQDELSDEGTVELFQHLVDTGLAWKLQGHYGRTAKCMIDHGLVSQSVQVAPTHTLADLQN